MYSVSFKVEKSLIFNISINIVGKPAEHASSTKFTLAAKAITPMIAKKKFCSLVNFLILLKPTKWTL